MDASLTPLLATGFLLGWSVAWPPGPINAEIARRCVAGGFFAGLALLAGACSADALWAVATALGVGLVFTGALAREAMGVVSIALLLALAAVFLGGAWRAFAREPGAPVAAAPSRFDSVHGGYGLGAAMALTSPWNVAFWLAAMGRPELAGVGAGRLLAMAGAVLAGALTWGVLWSGSTTVLGRRLDPDGGGRWWAIGVDVATGALMLYFALGSARRLVGA